MFARQECINGPMFEADLILCGNLAELGDFVA